MDVVYKNKEEFEAKVARIRDAGPNMLQVIADFDYTLTRFKIDGERASSSHGVVEKSPALGEDFSRRARKLFETYYPIEVSDMPTDEKTKKMIEWWTQTHGLIIEYKLKQEQLRDMVETPRLRFRDGVMDFFARTESKSVPVHIFSAGLYDVIHAFLDKTGANKHNNVHVVSNMMVWDDDGVVTDFQGTLIHTLNKNSQAIRDTGEWELVKDRKNVLLFGDNIGDVNMSSGLDIDNIIKVGFLNDRVEERLEQYKQEYDVVVLGDPDFQIGLELLSKVAP